MSTVTKQIVLTGAGGFLGAHLLARLVEDGWSVSAISSKTLPELLERAGLDEGCASCIRAVAPSDTEALARALKSADVLINAAFPRNAQPEAAAKGMAFIARVFELASKVPALAAINISSQSVYSQYRTAPATEAMPLCLESQYAAEKYASELLCEAYCSALPHTNIRLASLIGPSFNQRVVNKLAQTALQSGALQIQGGNQIFDLMDVRDAASALAVLAASDASTWKPIYNLGSGHPASLKDIACMVAHEVEAQQMAGGACKVEIEPPGQNAKVLNTSLDATCFMSNLDWAPALSLNDSVCAIVAAAKA